MTFTNTTARHNARIAGTNAPCLLVLSSPGWEIRVEPSLPVPLHWVRLYRMVESGDCLQCGYRYAWRCPTAQAGVMLAAYLARPLGGDETPGEQEGSLPRDLRRRGKEGAMVDEPELRRLLGEPG